MLVPKDGEDELPFDELDPCCQKEILEKRHRKDVNSKLRTIDRSTRRHDEKANVFCGVDPNKLWSCYCCEAKKDYEALSKLRERMFAVTDVDNPQFAQDHHSNDEEEDEEDSDDDLLDMDIPLTPFEQERLLEVERRQKGLTIAKSFGLAQHLEDSLDHCLLYASQLSTCFVLHIFQQRSDICAMVDWVIERDMCEQYPGTRFRRLEYNAVMLHDERLASRGWDSKISADGSILCIKNGNIVANQSSHDQLGESYNEIKSNLFRFLDQARVLESEIPALAIMKMSMLEAVEEDDDNNNEDDTRFCDDPDCLKRYQHEHVAKRDQDGKLLTAASFLSSQQQKGIEAFAPNALSRV